MRNLYDLLGVSKNASPEEIRTQYRRLARELHPDVNKNPKAAEQFNQIARAYEILGNKDARTKYDREETMQTNRHQEGAKPTQNGFQAVDDLFTNYGFSNFTGTKPNPQEQQQAQRNADAENAKRTRMEEKDELYGSFERTSKQSPFSQHIKDSGFEHFSDFVKKPNNFERDSDTPEVRPISGWKPGKGPSKEKKS